MSVQIVINKNQKEIKSHGNDQFPFLLSKECLSKYNLGSFLWHWHPEIELTLVHKGEMIYKVNNNIYHLKEGEALFCNSTSLHEGATYKNMDCIYTSITFHSKLVFGYDSSILYLKYVTPVIQDFSLSSIYFDYSENWHKEIIDLIHDIIEIEKSHPNAYELDIIIRLQQLWRLIILNYSLSSPSTDYDIRNYNRIKEIISYVEMNYSSHLTLEDIATHIHLCKGECCRIFKRYMKLSLFNFILDYRIERSIDQLIQTNDSIQTIALMVGFNDSNYYSKVFSKRKGCSPTQYRNKVTMYK